MSANVILRSGKDRLRYAVSFELLLLGILVPAGSLFFNKPVEEIGVLGVILAVKALLLNLVYNWFFDQIDAKAGRISSQRSHLGRVMHAIGFEVFMLITSLPIYVWFLEITYLDAFLTDIFVTTFVVGFTYAFTLVYDKIFPLSAQFQMTDG